MRLALFVLLLLMAVVQVIRYSQVINEHQRTRCLIGAYAAMILAVQVIR